MLNEMIGYFKNKKIAILGFGLEGKSTYEWFRKHLPNQPLFILDKNELLLSQNPKLEKDKHTEVIVGEAYLNDLNDYDIIIKSPGISVQKLGIHVDQNKITSQLELLLKYYRNQTIGITGTKGKSTTTTLIYQILKDQGKDVYLLGNIGKPIFSYIDDVTSDSILVVEMAALQLELVTCSPHIALLLNLFEEHLDYFGDKEKYFDAKFNIVKHQEKEDICFYGIDNRDIKLRLHNYFLRSHLIPLSFHSNLKIAESICIYKEEEYIYSKEKQDIKPIYYCNDNRNLLGSHNLYNIMFALAVSQFLNLDMPKVVETIRTFEPLEHRMECIGTFDGVTYYNDAIATIPEATQNCIETLGNVDSLIFGGMDRGIDYQSFIDFLSHSSIKNLIAMKETGHKIAPLVKECNEEKEIYLVESLEEAVRKAHEVTQKGSCCVMSPSAPSYNAFKNFEEKGRKFKELVRKIGK